MGPGPDLADLVVRVLLELVSDALLGLVPAVGVKELALVSVRALLAVGARLQVGVALPLLEKLLQGRAVPSHRVVRGHEPRKGKKGATWSKSAKSPHAIAELKIF